MAFSVNVDPEEADPTKIEPEELKERFGATNLIFADDPDDLSGTFKTLREGTSLWGVFLAAVLAVLVFESVVSNCFSPKREGEQAQNHTPGTGKMRRQMTAVG